MKSEDLQNSIVSNALKKMKQKESTLKINCKTLECSNNCDNLQSYHIIKDEIEETYEKKTEGARKRTKCLW